LSDIEKNRKNPHKICKILFHTIKKIIYQFLVVSDKTILIFSHFFFFLLNPRDHKKWQIFNVKKIQKYEETFSMYNLNESDERRLYFIFN
jgi:hypothetical protein